MGKKDENKKEEIPHSESKDSIHSNHSEESKDDGSK